MVHSLPLFPQSNLIKDAVFATPKLRVSPIGKVPSRCKHCRRSTPSSFSTLRPYASAASVKTASSHCVSGEWPSERGNDWIYFTHGLRHFLAWFVPLFFLCCVLYCCVLFFFVAFWSSFFAFDSLLCVLSFIFCFVGSFFLPLCVNLLAFFTFFHITFTWHHRSLSRNGRICQ